MQSDLQNSRTVEPAKHSGPNTVHEALAAGHLARDDFYAQLVTRNSGFISDATQQRLRNTTVLVAGCGSVGGAVVELLARMGVERFILADPEDFEISNCNRQHAYVEDLGRNKALCLGLRVRRINPFAHVCIEPDGVTSANVGTLVDTAHVIVDGVEVAVDSAREAKCLLHLEAFRRKRPVIAGADVATTAMVRCYEYQRPEARYYNGLISEDQIGHISMTQFITRDIPLWVMPVEMFGEIDKLLDGKPHFSQLGATAQMLGPLMAQAILDVVEGKRVRHLVQVDLPTLFRSRPRRLATFFARAAGLCRLIQLFFQIKKLGEKALPGWTVNQPEPERPTAAPAIWHNGQLEF